MRKPFVSILMFLVADVLCVGMGGARLGAEPIVGEESLGMPVPGNAPKSDSENGIALFKSGDYEAALKAFQSASGSNSNSPPAEVIMAQLFLQIGQVRKAEDYLRDAMAESPQDPEAYIVSAFLALQAKDYKKAEPLFTKANELLGAYQGSEKRKKAMQPHLLRGQAALAEERGDLAQAAKILEDVLRLEPKNTMVLQKLAFYRFRQKDVDGALNRLREMLKIDPASLTPEAALAQFYQNAGDDNAARKWMNAAVAADPKNIRTRLAAGQWALETGQLDEARKHSVAALRLDPSLRQTKFFRGAIAMFEKDYEAAESHFEAALKQAPNDFGLRNNLAVALIEQPDETKRRRALDIAEENIKRFPKVMEASSTYAWVLYRLGKLDEAEQAIQNAMATAKSDVDVAYIAARILVDRNKRAEARALLETALKTKSPALFRQEAEELVEQLKKS